MKNIKVKNLGPIQKADINFGDLTIFVGPQASGKSILLQLIKLITDTGNIRDTFEKYGYIWDKDPTYVLDRYFGEGMSGIWTSSTFISSENINFQKNNLLKKRGKPASGSSDESLFYIPAQRVVCLQNGWPRYFSDYEDSVPYVLRHFSETLRLFLEKDNNKEDEPIFPRKKLLKDPLRKSFNNSIFHWNKVMLDTTGKKRLKLQIGKSGIPFMAWSAGQKEFMPLLLSFYWLCPPSKVSRRKNIKFVVIEEPEMGLHPQAIHSVILQITDLISRGYKVIISTHSPVFLEFAWAVNILKKANAPIDNYFDLFEIPHYKGNYFHGLFQKLMTTVINTYYFDIKKSRVFVKNISTLDAGSGDEAIAEWGGLSSFSSKASEIVSNI